MLLGNLGTVYRRTGDWPLAFKMLRDSLKLYEELDDVLEIARRLCALARLLIMQRNFAEADLLLNKAEGLSQDYPRELAMAYESLGDLAKERGQLQKAKEYYQRTLGIARRLAPQGDLINQVQRRRAELLIMEGKDLEGASKCVQEALKVSQFLGDRFEEGCCYRTMGLLLQAKGNPKAAMENFEKAIKVLRSIEDKFELANTLLIQGEFSGRVDLLKEAESLFIQIQGAEFYQALALLQMAKVEPFIKSATQQLREAEEIFRARGEEGKLKEVESLKVALNQRLSSSQTQKYRVLQGLSSEELGKIFGRLIEEAGADRGFVAYAGDGGKKMKIEASHNLSEEETEGLLSLLADGNGFEAGKPFIIYDTALDDRFSSLGAYSVMLTPFGNGERIDGFLYLDRQEGKEPFLEKEFDLFYLLSERVTKAIYQRIQEELEEELAELRKNLKGSGMLTRNPQMLKILKVIELAKDCDTSILLSGETGTGKDFVARIIHQESIRKDKDFVEIPCGVIPKNLVETELFGYEKGAFTGATSRKLGRVELAEGGTLFLNEVGELPKSTQVKLLRFLDRSEFERVGGNKTIRVNTRVIAATNRDLKAEMEKGVFRKDLYYRLNGFCVGLPSLRERKEDIPLLANHFMKLWGKRYEKKVEGMAPEVLEAMMEYDWPGNIRELENVVERMVIMARQGEEITAELLPKEVKKSLQPEAGDVPTLTGKLASVEKEAIWDALKRTNGIKRRAATILGIPEATLRFRMKKHDLTFPQG